MGNVVKSGEIASEMGRQKKLRKNRVGRPQGAPYRLSIILTQRDASDLTSAGLEWRRMIGWCIIYGLAEDEVIAVEGMV